MPSNATFSFLKIRIIEEFNLKNTEIDMHLSNQNNTYLNNELCETNSVNYFGILINLSKNL